MRQWLLAVAMLLGAVPASVMGFSTGPPPGRTGAEIDGGLACNACHRGNDLNDGKGRLTLIARDYKPGVKQRILVVLEHPDASRWGFQLTARRSSNLAMPAGDFAANDLTRVRCLDGTDAPCATGPLFVEHGTNGTYRGQTGRASWEIEWTPPTGNEDVVFFIAGNAANNNGNNQGDFIYTGSFTVKAANCQITATPRITGVRGAASLVPGPFAMNTMITVDGTAFQPAGQSFTAESIDINDSKYPDTMGCVAVEVGGRRAPISYLDATQINTQMPAISGTGAQTVRVIANPGQSNEIRSEAFTIQLSDASPAFFRLLPTPCIAGLLPDGSITGDPTLISYTKPAKVGDVLTLFATGLGQTNPVYQAGEIPSARAAVRTPITLEWNNEVMAASDIMYVGLAPGYPSGVYAIMIRVPSIARPNVHNQLRIRQGGQSSPDNTTIFVAP